MIYYLNVLNTANIRKSFYTKRTYEQYNFISMCIIYRVPIMFETWIHIITMISS